MDGQFRASLLASPLTDPFTNCRALQYTEDESKVVRIVTNEVHVLDPKNFGNGIAEKLRLEGVTSFSISPGTTNACVALFVAEKKVSRCRCFIQRDFADRSCLFTGSARLRQNSLPFQSLHHDLRQEFLQSRQDSNEVEQVWKQSPLLDSDGSGQDGEILLR